LDEISKPVIIAPLTASRGRHGDHHRKIRVRRSTRRTRAGRHAEVKRSAEVPRTRPQTCRMSLHTAWIIIRLDS
jgi:hypothetical protein